MTLLVEVFRSDVGQVVLSRNIVDADLFILHEFTNAEKVKSSSTCFVRALKV